MWFLFNHIWPMLHCDLYVGVLFSRDKKVLYLIHMDMWVSTFYVWFVCIKEKKNVHWFTYCVKKSVHLTLENRSTSFVICKKKCSLLPLYYVIKLLVNLPFVEVFWDRVISIKNKKKKLLIDSLLPAVLFFYYHFSINLFVLFLRRVVSLLDRRLV